MRLILILMTLFGSINALAVDQWFCTSQASRVIGDGFETCGVAERISESEAREDALINAKKEFDAICDGSNSCRPRAYDLIPGRASCNTVPATRHSPEMYKCYRLVTYTKQ